jgi:hypothetical protein
VNCSNGFLISDGLAFGKPKSIRVDLPLMAVPQGNFCIAEPLSYTLLIITMNFRIRPNNSEIFHGKTRGQAVHVTTRPGAHLA